MEADVLQAAKKLYAENRAAILTFHLNEDEYVQGLICGGSLDVLIEPIDGTMAPLFEQLRKRCEEGEDSVVATLLADDGRIIFKHLVNSEDTTRINGMLDEWSSRAGITPPLHHSTTPALRVDLSEELRKAFHRHETRRIKVEAGELLLEPIAGTPGLIIFGGGHVSKFIARTAAMAGFRVTVVDDRPEYANAHRFPEAAKTLAVEATQAFNELRISSSTYIVIVTRGHRHDEEILERAVQTAAKYIGMIGSKRKVLTTYEHLIERGISHDQLSRVHAPLGIEIGAATLEEIGISVVGELIAVRRGQEGVVMHKSEAMKKNEE